MLRWALAFCTLFLCACSGSQHPAAHEPQPNIVIILADDLGYGDLGCYGQTRWRTPNLDRLAATGARFTSYYSAQAVCSASRAALLTGCYPNRLHIAGALGPGSTVGLNPAETTIADACRSRGYATAVFGKWHLGDAPNLLPPAQGFDEFFGIPYSNDMWPLHPDLVRLPPQSEERKRGYPPLPLIEGAAVADAEVTVQEQSTFTREFTRRACDFIDRNAHRPFLLYVPHPMPHVPIFCSTEFEGVSGAGRYGDVIEELDWSVGRIVEELKRHDLRRRTVVIFTSDNGPWLSYGDHAGTTAGLREGKGTSWEGGVRVPFIVSWPGHIPAGKVFDTPAMAIDILPTVDSFIGVKSPPVDGVSLSTLLTHGKDAALDDRALAFYYNANDLEAVRQGRWKLILPHSYRTLTGAPGSGGSPGPYRQVRSGLELYDLHADRSETTNVASSNHEVVRRLEQAAQLFRQDLGDNLTNQLGTGRRPAGKADRAPN